jgi:hypothetical protein
MIKHHILFLVLGTVLLHSCTKDSIVCDCDDLINKRWHQLQDLSVVHECFYFEDFILSEDGTVTVYRYGRTGDGTLVENVELKNVAKWTLASERPCKINFSHYDSVAHDPGFYLTDCAPGKYFVSTVIRNLPYTMTEPLISCDLIAIDWFLYSLY